MNFQVEKTKKKGFLPIPIQSRSLCDTNSYASKLATAVYTCLMFFCGFPLTRVLLIVIHPICRGRAHTTVALAAAL
ncbi:hypothetical protein LZ554_003962 [Drepanopeziza brunnea f. sp. 'monogermtubi']|nr:hypothetical protein LZ554_003962 [Drepanopeziza brunnea f. sp. 'monogermtubi']